MDIKQQTRPRLEPIQEESEREDETEENLTGWEYFQFHVGAETEEELAGEEEEDDALLRVMRPRRLSPSISRENSTQIQSAHNHQEEVENVSVSDVSTCSADQSDGDTSAETSGLRPERRSSSRRLRMTLSKIQWPARMSPKPQKKRKKQKKSLVDPFPAWLVDLMVNIEEATTHELVIE